VVAQAFTCMAGRTPLHQPQPAAVRCPHGRPERPVRGTRLDGPSRTRSGGVSLPASCPRRDSNPQAAESSRHASKDRIGAGHANCSTGAYLHLSSIVLTSACRPDLPRMSRYRPSPRERGSWARRRERHPLSLATRLLPERTRRGRVGWGAARTAKSYQRPTRAGWSLPGHARVKSCQKATRTKRPALRPVSHTAGTTPLPNRGRAQTTPDRARGPSTRTPTVRAPAALSAAFRGDPRSPPLAAVTADVMPSSADSYASSLTCVSSTNHSRSCPAGDSHPVAQCCG
jgi:hypothetical protein